MIFFMVEMSSTLKLVLVGESGVGKTAYIKRLQNKDFEGLKSTIDMEFHTVVVNFRNRPLTLSIYDFGGKNQYRFMQSSHLKGVYGIILMFDLSNETSFRKLSEWIEFLKPVLKSYPNFPTVLIGNKADLKNSQISEDTINSFVKSNNISLYEEASVKEGRNVEEPLQKLILKIMQFYLEIQKKAQDAKAKIETLIQESEKTHEKILLEEIQKTEEEVDLITSVRHVIKDMANLNLKEMRSDLKDLRKNIRRTFKIIFTPTPTTKEQKEPVPKKIEKEEVKEPIKKVTKFKVLKSDALKEGMTVYIEKSIDD